MSPDDPIPDTSTDTAPADGPTDAPAAGPTGSGLAAEKARRFSSMVQDVTEFLAKEVLKNDDHGTVINWLTQEQFMARLEDPYYQNRDIFSDIKDKL